MRSSPTCCHTTDSSCSRAAGGQEAFSHPNRRFQLFPPHTMGYHALGLSTLLSDLLLLHMHDGVMVPCTAVQSGLIGWYTG